MKYEDRRSPEYVNGIIDLLIEDSRWIKAQKETEMECRLHQEMQFLACKVKANARFEHSKENIEKLLRLNRRLHELQDEYICYAMHKFFADGCYSLEDAMRMKLEDFYVHTEIYI